MFTNVQDAEKISAYGLLKETLLRGEKLEFEEMALAVFRLQAEHNPIYQRWIEYLGIEAKEVRRVKDIPFLPIDFFKSQRLSIFESEPELFFQSSGTGGYGQSKHAVYNLALYDQLCDQAFTSFYGPVKDYTVLALLPAYLERKGSSLVRMADRFISQSEDPDSGFYLDKLAALSDNLKDKKAQGKKILLLGVSFALWDLAEQFPMDLSGAIIMETGGMKGRRKEILRKDLHEILKEAFQVEEIHSEYGMTELYSQAYSRSQGLFETSSTMQVMIREMEDPFSWARNGKSGGINIIDLGNLDTCSFIETQDLGRMHSDGRFEVLGRFDRAEVRGCNLMVH